MTHRSMIRPAVIGLAIFATAGLLGGCTYDYLQRSDRVAYHSGDAVKANIARQTSNPSKKSMNNVNGLGKNGVVLPPPAE